MLNIWSYLRGLRIIPTSVSAIDRAGEMEVLQSDGKLYYHDGTIKSAFVTENGAETLTNKTIDANSNSISNISNANISLTAAIDSTKIANGSVSNVEFQYLDGVTSNIQTQLDSKQSTITANSITNSELAQMPAHTIKGNNTGSTANASDLTATQVTAELNAFVGDSGSGGTKGLVPAPAPGDAAANKFLKADGTFTAVPASGTSTIGTIDSQPKSADGAVISGSTLYMQTADATTHPGLVSTTSQSFGGLKSFEAGARIGATSINQGALISNTSTSASSTSVDFGVATNRIVTDTSSLGVFSASGSTANSAATGSVYIESGNKTAGTGNSGDIALQTGSSSGGTRGRIKNTSASGITIKEVTTPGTNPASTYHDIYPKSDGQFYSLDSAGVERQFITGTSSFQFFVSNAITTNSSSITGTTFTTFSNSPAFTFTPTVTGTYKIYGGIGFAQSTGGVQGFTRIFNTSGGATLLQESNGTLFPTILSTLFMQNIYTLTSGMAYVFDIQGKNSSTGDLIIDGAGSTAYLFAELCG